MFWPRWHTFVGMDSAAAADDADDGSDDSEVIGDGDEEEAVDSVAESGADDGGVAADVHVGQKLA